jgi:signal transduction histidine kinase
VEAAVKESGGAHSSGRASRRNARTALLAGFGALMAVAVVGAVDEWLTLRQLQTRSEAILNQYIRRERILSHARSGAYSTTTSLRDFVLDPDPAHAQRHLDQVRLHRERLNSAIVDYRPLMARAEGPVVDELAADVERYWRDVEPVFTWTIEQRRRDGFQFLASRVLPWRVRLLELTDSIAHFNQLELFERQRLLSDLFSQARWRMGIVLALSLLLGSGVAVVCFLYLARLERVATAHFEEVVQTRGELQRLSQRLVEAQEQERRALSRELHDEVGQSLSALLVDVANAAAATPPGHPELAERHNSIRTLAERTLAVIRNMSLLLRPSMLDDLGLVPALEWQAREMARRTGREVEVDADEVPDNLPEDVRTCVYRVVQEALNNVLRHAAATHVAIIVRQDGVRLLVLIRDDGRGFDPREVRAGGAGHRGAGLIGIDERVRALGGVVRIESQPGRGCLIQAELPLAPSGSPGDLP